MHAFCGVPGLEGRILTPRETNSLFGACLSKTNGLIERPRARRALIRSLSANLSGALSLNLPERIDIRSLEDASACFISIAYLHICIKTRFIGQNSAIKWRFGENMGGGRSCGKLAASKVAGEGCGGSAGAPHVYGMRSLPLGEAMRKQVPTMFSSGTQPMTRLSVLLLRLSPRTKTCPSGTVMESPSARLSMRSRM